MKKKLMVGVAALGFAVPTAGILAAGAVRAQQTPTKPPAQGQPAQTTPVSPTGGAHRGAETEKPPTLPSGSVSQEAAQQAATAFVQQTAPYNTQGLTVKAVKVDDEDGTAVYKVTFSNASGQDAEVTVNPLTGKVLKAEAEGTEGDKSGGQDTETDDAPGTAGRATAGTTGH